MQSPTTLSSAISYLREARIGRVPGPCLRGRIGITVAGICLKVHEQPGKTRCPLVDQFLIHGKLKVCPSLEAFKRQITCGDILPKLFVSWCIAGMKDDRGPIISLEFVTAPRIDEDSTQVVVS